MWRYHLLGSPHHAARPVSSPCPPPVQDFNLCSDRIYVCMYSFVSTKCPTAQPRQSILKLLRCACWYAIGNNTMHGAKDVIDSLKSRNWFPGIEKKIRVLSLARLVNTPDRLRDDITHFLKFKDVIHPRTHPFWELSIVRAIVLLSINQRTKFEVPIFTSSKND